MLMQYLIILAVVAMVGLALLRVARVRAGRTPLPDGRGRLLFILGFLVVPPIALGALIDPNAAAGPLRGAGQVPVYVVVLVALAFLMWIAALVVQQVSQGRSRRILLLALVGKEPDPEDVPFDPPLTAILAEGVERVDVRNAVFPRGHAFPAEIDRSGFRGTWDALAAATEALEARIADDHRLGVAVASRATATARDARGRLDTLRRLALDHGQAWAS